MKKGVNYNAHDAYVMKMTDDVIIVGLNEVQWSVTFGSNLLMYKSLDSLIPDDEEEYTKEIEDEVYGLVTMWFADTNIIFDKEYLESKHNITDEYLKRVKERVGGVSGKEAEVIGSFFEEK